METLELADSSSLAAPLLVPASRQQKRSPPSVPVATLALLLAAATVFWLTPRSVDAVPRVEVLAEDATDNKRSYWYGVSLGGWLVMEINPSHRGPGSSPDLRPDWMFDAISAICNENLFLVVSLCVLKI